MWSFWSNCFLVTSCSSIVWGMWVRVMKIETWNMWKKSLTLLTRSQYWQNALYYRFNILLIFNYILIRFGTSNKFRLKVERLIFGYSSCTAFIYLNFLLLCRFKSFVFFVFFFFFCFLFVCLFFFGVGLWIYGIIVLFNWNISSNLDIYQSTLRNL